MKKLLFCLLILSSCKNEPEQRTPIVAPAYNTPPPYNPEEGKKYEEALMRKAGAVEATTKKYVFVKATVEDGRCFTSEILEYKDLSDDEKAKLLDKAEDILTDGSFGASSVTERSVIISDSYTEASDKLHNIENRGKFKINQF